jgi:hypothetical protein
MVRNQEGFIDPALIVLKFEEAIRRILACAGHRRFKTMRAVVSRRSEVAPCCALDEGRSLGAALQEEASNHHERLLLNGDGRERHG